MSEGLLVDQASGELLVVVECGPVERIDLGGDHPSLGGDPSPRWPLQPRAFLGHGIPSGSIAFGSQSRSYTHYIISLCPVATAGSANFAPQNWIILRDSEIPWIPQIFSAPALADMGNVVRTLGVPSDA